MKNKVYGVLGIKSEMANWNADFTGYPKTTSDGTVFGSDKAFKYPIKKSWDQKGEKVLYIKSYKLNQSKEGTTVVPRTLKERYEYLVGQDLKKDAKEVLKNLFDCIDVKCFGATFAESGINLSITGAIQIGQGLNKDEKSDAQEQTILSPFRDPHEEDAANSTLGTKIVSDQAHYFYPFSINPLAYKDYIELEVTEGLTTDDYKKFKDEALSAATVFATNSKIGCENEFALFVEGDEDLYIPNLTNYITFERGEVGEKNTIFLRCNELLDSIKDRINSIEVYYNTNTTNLDTDLKDVRLVDIMTRKEV